MDLCNKVKTLQKIFDGYSKAHGIYKVTSFNERKGKSEGSASTVHAPWTNEDWEGHLNGVMGLGGIPLRDDNTCVFAVIDVDDYQLSFDDFEEKIDNHQLPLVLCRSKSGGAHLYVFFVSPMPAQDVVSNLKAWASMLGVAGAEIFPKQDHRATEKDIGNWINLPYFDEEKTDRYAIHKGKHLSLTEFFKLVEIKKVKSFEDHEQDFTDNGLFEDGPPCLQRLAKFENGQHMGFGEGERNNGMYNVAVFLRKRNPDSWEHEMGEYNNAMCDEPLRQTEITTLTGSAKKKEYEYKCSERPISDYCNKKLCRTRKYGIGETSKSSGMPDFEGIELYPGDPAYWVIDVGGQRIQATTDQLYSITAFNKLCMEHLHCVPIKLNQGRWVDFLNELVQKVIEHPKEEEAYDKGQFWAIANMYFYSSSGAQTREQLLTGPPWKHIEKNKICFLSMYLMKFLKENGLRFDVNQVWKTLKEGGGGSTKIRIGKETKTVWFVPMKEDEFENAIEEF